MAAESEPKELRTARREGRRAFMPANLAYVFTGASA
jgi:hypothetical protein